MSKVIVAPRLSSQAHLPDDWQAQLEAIPGVEVHGKTENRMQASFSASALSEAKDKFEDGLIFEDAVPTRFAS
jgi:hypothetical protein